MVSLFRRNKSTVGLDIGSGFIKVAVVDHSGAEPELTHVSHTPLIADAIVEGEVMDPQIVVETVRSLVETSGLKPKRLISSVGGRDVMVKKIQMDRMKEADAREVIRWEAEQYVPFDMENVQLDFQILDPLDDGLQMSVLLVAAKREVVDQRVGLLRDAGLSPDVVDVDSFALHNAFEYNYPEAMEGIVALVNVGHEIATVNVLQDGAMVLTRDVPFGSRRLREDMRRMHGLTVEEADAVLQGRSERAGEFSELLRQGADDLAVGVERALAFLGGDAAPGRVYVCGGGARIPGMVDVLAARLRARTEVASPLQRLRVRPGVTSFVAVDELAPMLMLSVGLALRGGA
ncbi:type IV pilus assembly protein PilM [Longimicrobium terrae]|uniref:Type IV pilus assembly protein PilM n=1 Tax=Longimicrobium terrae TaxID=1639882 RepID=A0A841H629_9BACT|nr:type IV pilus assembly protein PilM [Longimicrobium terrae]MBB4639214.1 type IV pilus assembly protein PilM [Longimicrobium terrae]MBB6073382.1 type IV pilus assembly protein PilM [Longimicrobium terrae]NNC32630.1 type IV pilus assembly protein PilM [Longimicrobium terrae]